MTVHRFALIFSIGFFGSTMALDAGASDDDHGNTRSSATRIALPSTTAGTIDPGNDADYFRFDVAGGGAVVLESAGDLDTIGTLFDASGSRIAQNDDGAGYPNFRIERSLAAGTYYVRVHSYGTATGAYTLHLRGDGGSGGSDRHGNTRSSATRVALPSTTTGRIDPGNDTDYFRFELSARASVVLETAGGLDTIGTLFNARGSRIAQNNDGAGRPNFRIERTLAAGTYYVRVHSRGTATGAYTLHLRGDGGNGGSDRHGNTRSSATRVALPSTATGRIDPGNDTDYFRFEVSSSSTVVLESTGDLDALGTLFDARGARIVQDDDSAGYPNFLIERTLEAGTYYVRVHSSGTATGAYTLHLRGGAGGGDGGGGTGPPGEAFRDCAECPLMVTIPAGSFSMGAPESEAWSGQFERPQRTVSVPSFAAGAYEVTFAEWDACVAEGGCFGDRLDDAGWGRGDRPVTSRNLSWPEVQGYVEWLSGKTGEAYRLLTEAEWEYAARAGTTTPFHTGGTISPQQANYDGRYGYPLGYNEGGLYRGQTVPVGSFAPNAFGLYDMHGNVKERVQDCLGSYSGAPVDGGAVYVEGCDRVVRGGSWDDTPTFIRSAHRFTDRTRLRYTLGFRVARTLAP